MTDAPAITTPKALASELGITPKALRRILRTMTDDRAGKGGVWKLDAVTVAAITAKVEGGVRTATTPTLKD